MNKIIVTGRLTKNVEIYETQSQTKVAKFTLAVNRDFKNPNGTYDTDFFNCVSFLNAEIIGKYCQKGDLILVDGRLQNRTYEDDKQNKHYITEIICNRVEFLSKVSKSSQEEKQTVNEPKNELNDEVFADFGNSIEISDDEICF